MAEKFTSSGNKGASIEWMYKPNSDPWSTSQPEQWTRYSDVENLIIEDAYSQNESHVMLDKFYIDFKRKIQVSKDNENNQRPIKRVVRKKKIYEYEKNASHLIQLLQNALMDMNMDGFPHSFWRLENI